MSIAARIIGAALTAALWAAAALAQADAQGFASVVRLMERERVALASLDPAEATSLPTAAPIGPASADDVDCLARAIYHEARGEARDGRRAVAEVVLNRVVHDDYPDSICGVVHDRRFGGCQFSWVCMGVAPPRRGRVFADAQSLAVEMIGAQRRSLTDGATHFHTTAIRPGWSRRLTRTTTIGSHIFYR